MVYRMWFHLPDRVFKTSRKKKEVWKWYLQAHGLLQCTNYKRINIIRLSIQFWWPENHSHCQFQHAFNSIFHVNCSVHIRFFRQKNVRDIYVKTENLLHTNWILTSFPPSSSNYMLLLIYLYIWAQPTSVKRQNNFQKKIPCEIGNAKFSYQSVQK